MKHQILTVDGRGIGGSPTSPIAHVGNYPHPRFNIVLIIIDFFLYMSEENEIIFLVQN